MMLMWLMNLGFAGSDAGGTTYPLNQRHMLVNLSRGGM